jgi:hypothetical protein
VNPNCLLEYIPNTLIWDIITEVTKYQKFVKKRKNKRHRRASTRLEVRYMNKLRAFYNWFDIDLPQFV